MFVQQFFVKGLAHNSYLLGSSNTCAIIDPRRDVEIYLPAAKEMGMKITHILETHLHADFVSGHLDLAEKTGETIPNPPANMKMLSGDELICFGKLDNIRGKICLMPRQPTAD